MAARAHAQNAPKVPIIRAAGIGSSATKIIPVGDRSFIGSSALMEAKTPKEIIGVLAHEPGPISGGRLMRERPELAPAGARDS